jgi:general secretion pathway protein C
MLARLSAFVIWALIAAPAVFWGLRFAVRAPVIPPHAVASGDTGVAGADLTRLLGAPPVAAQAVAQVPEASSRFRLLGIVAPKRAHAGEANGVALIAVAGKPPRAFAVGARVDDDLVLQAVSLRTASIGPTAGQKSVVLEIPKLPAAATGTLPPIGTPAAALAPPSVIAPPPPAIVPAPQPLPSPAVGAPPGPVSIERDGGVRVQ